MDGTDEAYEADGADGSVVAGGVGFAFGKRIAESRALCVFPEKRRLLIERGGKVATYDSGPHQISGVAQREGHDRALAFTSQEGVVDLDELKQIS